MVIDRQTEKTWVRSYAYLASGRAVKVDAKGLRENLAPIVAAIQTADGDKRFAGEFVRVASQGREKKLSGHMQRFWRFASYLAVAGGDEKIGPKLATGYSMTPDGLAKMLTDVKPDMIAGGYVKETGRKVQTTAERQSAWEDRILARLVDASDNGVKGSKGSTGDIPAWDALRAVKLKIAHTLAERKGTVTAERPHAAERSTVAVAVNG